MRIDRWLWAARFFKTRGAATDAVAGGKAHVNGVRVKPSKDVRAGDRLEVTIGDVRRELVVRAVAEKRGPASVAATLYEETPESIADREKRRDASRGRSAPTSAGGRRSATAAGWMRCGAPSGTVAHPRRRPPTSTTRSCGPCGASENSIAGAGFEPATSGL